MSYPPFNTGYQPRPAYQGWPTANHHFMGPGTYVNNGAWPTSGGHQSYYGPASQDYDYHTETDLHAPSLSTDDLSYQQTSDAGRAKGSKKGSGIFKGIKKNNSSLISALTLLSFFFFLNILNNCIRDQMDSVNPTVMVMTANLKRKSNKMDITNSRQQSSAENLAAAVSSVKHTKHVSSTERYRDSLESISSSPFSHLPVNPYAITTQQQFQSPYLEQHPDSYDSGERYINSTLGYENYFQSKVPVQITNKPLMPHIMQRPNHRPVEVSSYEENEYPYHESESSSSSSSSHTQSYINSNFPWALKRSSVSSFNLGPYRRASIVSVTPTAKWTLITTTNNNK
uniref:Uncharacterized protein n=1 Tax=Glossina palpalis gambiensis TaxID=67801 RepID=A0A1B0C6A4_9MUSC